MDGPAPDKLLAAAQLVACLGLPPTVTVCDPGFDLELLRVHGGSTLAAPARGTYGCAGCAGPGSQADKALLLCGMDVADFAVVPTGILPFGHERGGLLSSLGSAISISGGGVRFGAGGIGGLGALGFGKSGTLGFGTLGGFAATPSAFALATIF